MNKNHKEMFIYENNGDKFHYLNGELHREDGPAIEYANGDKTWYLNGDLHREDGPAIEWSNGYKEWWINGEFYSKESSIKEKKFNDYFYVCRFSDGRLFASKINRNKQPWCLLGPEVNLNKNMTPRERESRLTDFVTYKENIKIEDIISGRTVYICVHNASWFDIMTENELKQYLESNICPQQ